MNSPIVSEYPVQSIEEPDCELAIRLENISVRYRLPQETFGTLKEYALRRLRGCIKKVDFWALRGLDLEIYKGEAFGVIGPNGAGKSTLLKVLARVLHPTTGRVWVRGHLAPLLELGAGFQLELTGRENIYLNGAILGFSRKELKKKIERIVEFAELGHFVDAPLRTFSSGMIARLGFAIATDVRPDILLLDEILAVGDEAFQRRSGARIQEIRRQGATVVLVSHSMQTVQTMCQRAMWIDKGVVRSLGTAVQVTSAYQESAL